MLIHQVNNVSNLLVCALVILLVQVYQPLSQHHLFNLVLHGLYSLIFYKESARKHPGSCTSFSKIFLVHCVTIYLKCQFLISLPLLPEHYQSPTSKFHQRSVLENTVARCIAYIHSTNSMRSTHSIQPKHSMHLMQSI